MMEKIGALVASALVLTVAVPAVGADSYEEARDEYWEAVEAFQGAYTDWLSARTDFLQVRIQWREDRTAANLANVVEKAKIALLAADNVMIKRLEMLRARVEATRGLSDNEKTAIYAEIDSDISWLQGKQTDIQNADNMRDVIIVALTVWDYWRDVRVEIKQIIGQILGAWTDALVQRAEAFAGRVEAKIEELKENGIDTSDLESWLADYNSAIELAKGKYDQAKEKFSQIPSAENPHQLFWEGVALIREGNSYLRDAFRALRDIISDMRSSGHSVTLTGSGTLIAHGDGRAYLSGTGAVHVVAPIQGTMLVSPNANVTTVGEGTKTVLENDWVRYQGYGGATVTGTDIIVDISGDDISILAAGTGTAVLTGTGSYRTYGENKYGAGSWTEAPVTVTLATGEVSAGVV